MKTKVIQVFQHVEVEGPAYIAQWAEQNNVELRFTKFFEAYEFPAIDSFDLLIVMGGPMGVYDEKAYPWIISERNYIQQCIDKNKAILGICLGAQFLAAALGAKVYKNTQKEIGWFPINKSEGADINNKLTTTLPKQAQVFHWHGDTFDIPTGATRLFHSKATPNQAFVFKQNTIALQFHLEATTESLENMVSTFASELIEDEYVQNATQILKADHHITETNLLMSGILQVLLT